MVAQFLGANGKFLVIEVQIHIFGFLANLTKRKPVNPRHLELLAFTITRINFTVSTFHDKAYAIQYWYVNGRHKNCLE